MCPFESEFIRKHHALPKILEPTSSQSILHKLWVITKAYKESVVLFDCWRLFLFFLVKVRSIEIIFIVILVKAENAVFSWSPLKAATAPFMFRAVALANTFKPCVDRAVVEFDRMVGGRFKLIGIEVLYYSFLPSSSD